MGPIASSKPLVHYPQRRYVGIWPFGHWVTVGWQDCGEIMWDAEVTKHSELPNHMARCQVALRLGIEQGKRFIFCPRCPDILALLNGPMHSKQLMHSQRPRTSGFTVETAIDIST